MPKLEPLPMYGSSLATDNVALFKSMVGNFPDYDAILLMLLSDSVSSHAGEITNAVVKTNRVLRAINYASNNVTDSMPEFQHLLQH